MGIRLEKTIKQFETGKPVWYVNKKTKKVYAGVYQQYQMGYHIVFTTFNGFAYMKDECLFTTKMQARAFLLRYLLELRKKLVDNLERLTKEKFPHKSPLMVCLSGLLFYSRSHNCLEKKWI